MTYNTSFLGQRRTACLALFSGLAVAGLTVTLLKSFPQLEVGLAVADAASFVASLILFFESFTKRGRMRPHWQRIVLWMIGPIGLGWTLLNIALLLALKHEITPATYHLLDHLRTLFLGMGLGVLLLLGISPITLRSTSNKSGT